MAPRQWKDKWLILTWASGLIYTIFSMLLAGFYMLNVMGFSFPLTVWSATLTATVVLCYAWSSFILGENHHSRGRVTLAFLTLLVSIAIFWLGPSVWSNAFLGLVKLALPAIGEILEDIGGMPVTNILAAMWLLVILIPTLVMYFLKSR